MHLLYNDEKMAAFLGQTYMLEMDVDGLKKLQEEDALFIQSGRTGTHLKQFIKARNLGLGFDVSDEVYAAADEVARKLYEIKAAFEQKKARELTGVQPLSALNHPTYSDLPLIL